jgi:murein DD-endopeptidase MepM/ murein hydrolase activator NlpD
MLIPQNSEKVKSIKIPGLFFKSAIAVVSVFILFCGILIFDYWKVLSQINENKHLSIENNQLREQVQVFQMKLNSLSDDLSRINTFEKKLRIITGLEDRTQATIPMIKEDNSTMMDDHSLETLPKQPKKDYKGAYLDNTNKKNDKEFIELKKLYSKKIAQNIGFKNNYSITKKWSEIIKNSFDLADKYANFDYSFNILKRKASQTESNINELDRHLLNKKSLLNSTPTILPTNGWITSYFGPRKSPHSGRIKMHEGLDVGAKYGTPIIAPADGFISFAGKKSGFGLFVRIDHGYGIQTLFAHSQKLHVKKGQIIKRGHLIAEVGNTGHSTGPHLHYEVRVNGVAVDPLYFVLK